jgi:hypothetical protein
MARRLTLEGAKVLGVYEAMQRPGGLLRNVVQCLNDFDIPLHLGHTVTRVFGVERLEAVEICQVNKNLEPIRGTEKHIKCDALILAVGLIPENELAESLNVELCRSTRGPLCDQHNMTMVDGIFSCGNAMHISDLVDHVSESGEIAGYCAAHYNGEKRTFADVNWGADFLYVVPQRIDVDSFMGDVVMFFRSSEVRKKTILRVFADGKEVFSEQFAQLRPPEMQRIVVNFGDMLQPRSKISFKLEAPAPDDASFADGVQSTGDSVAEDNDPGIGDDSGEENLQGIEDDLIEDIEDAEAERTGHKND